jgi:peroxiredoxin
VQETGPFFEAPLGPVNRLSYWEQHEDHRPRRGWRVAGVETCIDTSCLKLQWTQQSPDWNAPRADSTAWRREDTIWFAYQAGQVFRVERIIERREPGRTAPTQRIITKYELASRFRYIAEWGNEAGGRLYDDRMDEINKFLKFQEEAAPLLQQPAHFRKNIDALLGKIAAYVEKNPPNHYRNSVVHLKNKLERARTGEVPPSTIVAVSAVEVQPLRVGIDKVPSFVIAELTSLTAGNTRKFEEYLGQPVLVLYYDPATPTGKEVLLFAQKLCDKYEDDLQVLGMAVSDDLELVRRQHQALDLSFPILDGKAMIRAFGVDGTPRVVVLDAQGVVRCAFTGWGFHSPAEVDGEIRKLMPKK